MTEHLKLAVKACHVGALQMPKASDSRPICPPTQLYAYSCRLVELDQADETRSLAHLGLLLRAYGHSAFESTSALCTSDD